MGIKVTLSGLDDDIAAIAQYKESVVRGAMDDIIEYLVTASPVDTGAYIESHTIKSNNTRGRGRDSSKRKRGSGGEANRELAMNQLLEDVEKLDFNSDKFVIRNDSKHSVFVEFGTAKVKAYNIYEGISAVQFSGKEKKAYGKQYDKYYKGRV